MIYTPTEFYHFEEEQAEEFKQHCLAYNATASTYFDKNLHLGELLMDVSDDEAGDARCLFACAKEELSRYQGLQIAYQSTQEEEQLRAFLNDGRVLFALRPERREAFLVFSPSYQIQLAQALVEGK